MSNRIEYLHSFRGFAIINIVCAHAWSFLIFGTGNLDSEGLAHFFYFTETLFHSSTIYFALISGILFSQVLHQKSWVVFYRSKVRNVLTPYIFLTLLFILVFWRFYFGNTDISAETYALKALEALLYGTGSAQFWYIPVLGILFILTPILVRVADAPMLFSICLIALPLVISRSPFPDFIQPQTFVYFIGVYHCGLLIGRHLDKVLNKVERFQWHLFGALLIFSVALFALYKGGYSSNSVFSATESLFYLQKIVISLLALNLFKKLDNKTPPLFSHLANYSFAIYFLHLIFIGALVKGIEGWLSDHRSVATISLLGFSNLIISISAVIVIAFILKRILGSRTRLFIGV